ncbi:MAG: hypothetical protein PHE17_19365 [Thiothrix sp.]|nr:hypothetical protein [Thiothrix sp.]MDD5395187.1 hypothetical protein [Thiothrix sp.]
MTHPTDCIPAKHYGKLEKCKTCVDRHTCAGDARGDSVFDLNKEEE